MRTALGCLTASLIAASLHAQSGLPPDIPERARGAHRVVVATVLDVNASFARTAYGDQVIVSRVMLRVDEALKGHDGTPTLQLEVEGGTVGDLTMGVSDLPTVAIGDRGVFFVERTASGTHVPHRRGLGILKLDAEDQVLGSSLTLETIRNLVRGAAR